MPLWHRWRCFTPRWPARVPSLGPSSPTAAGARVQLGWAQGQGLGRGWWHPRLALPLVPTLPLLRSPPHLVLGQHLRSLYSESQALGPAETGHLQLWLRRQLSRFLKRPSFAEKNSGPSEVKRPVGFFHRSENLWYLSKILCRSGFCVFNFCFYSTLAQ